MKALVIFGILLLTATYNCTAQKGSHWIPMLRAQVAIKKENYIKADSLTDKAYARFIRKKEKKTWMYAEYAHFLGHACIKLRKDTSALIMFEKATKTLEAKKHPNQRFIAHYTVGMALIYSDLGDYEKSLYYHKKSLDIWLRKLGKNHIYVAISYGSMASIYGALGDYEKSLSYHEKSLEIRLKKLGKSYLDVASSYDGLASVYYDLGNYEKSLSYYEKSLEIRLKKLGKNHVDVAASYNGLAWVYLARGNYYLQFFAGSATIKIFEFSLLSISKLLLIRQRMFR